MKNTPSPIASRQPPKLPVAPPHWTLALPKSVLIFAIRAYQLTLSPALTLLFGGTAGCRFTPTCSTYALDALREHGAGAGTILAAKRICRCQPWGGCGHDPVPPKKSSLTPQASLITSAHP